MNNREDIKKMDDETLKKEYANLYKHTEHSDCFSTGDMLLLCWMEEELSNRNIVAHIITNITIEFENEVAL